MCLLVNWVTNIVLIMCKNVSRPHGINANCSSCRNDSTAHSNFETQVMPTRKYARVEQEAKTEVIP